MRESYSFRSDSRETPGPRQPSFKMSSEQLLVILGFVTIGILFTATLVAYVVTRVQVHVFRPEASPGLPIGLFGSTAMIFGVSMSMHSAYRSVVENRQESLRRSLWLGLAFAAAFVVGQGFNWAQMIHEQSALPAPTLFAFTFYLLTGLHAVHVLGGFIPLGIVIHRAARREYSSSRADGVRFCVWYWHYLGVIWLVLLSVMLIAQ
jgi:cytochrome c oxidase subunit III